MTNELTQKQVTSNVATRIEAMKGEGTPDRTEL